MASVWPCSGHTGHIGLNIQHARHVSCMDYSCPFSPFAHLCSLLGTLSHYTALEVWAIRRLMHVCCGSRWGRCVLFINILDSLVAPRLVYNTAMYTVYGRCGQYGRCMFIHWPMRGLYGPIKVRVGSSNHDHIPDSNCNCNMALCC